MAKKTMNIDLRDSEKDTEKLKQEKATLDLPDVKDIPGQENIHVPELREMADTTASSDDEEGVGIFGDDDDAEYSSDRLPVGEELDENDLIIGDDEELEADLDEKETDDEESDDDLDVTDDIVDEDFAVTEDEKIALERTENLDTQDNENLYRSELDNTDFDGEKLNEDDGDISGKDLDVPGAEEDDENEDIGEEDEENNEYSLGDTE
ncbi:MAG: hypothetical protein JO072_07550 [Parafilimonas sp.]|nr:hypothetical protein [Parafilimonas sp.]